MCPECTDKTNRETDEHNRRVRAHIDAGLPMVVRAENGVIVGPAGFVGHCGTYVPCEHQLPPWDHYCI